MDPKAFAFMALSGEQQYEKRGVVVVNTDEGHAKYHTVDALPLPTEGASKLRTQIEATPDLLYILQKTSTHVHVFTYPKARALDDLARGELPMLQEK